MEQFIDFLQTFAFELAKAILPIIGGFIIFALNALIAKWKAELEASKPKLADYLAQAVDIAIYSAEQAGLHDLVEDKLQYAVNIAQEYLSENGWEEVNVELLVAAIEAEVLKQFPN